MAAHSLSLPTRAPPLLRLLLSRPRRAPAFRSSPAAAAAAAPPRASRGAIFSGARGIRRRGGVGSRTMSSSTNSTAVAESAIAKSGANVELLPFVEDKHGGVIIEMTAPMDPQVFSASLKSALSKWREQVVSSTMGNKRCLDKITHRPCQPYPISSRGRILVPSCRGSLLNARILASEYDSYITCKCYTPCGCWSFCNE